MARSGRGRHKVFLGMAAGVGKTYRMLHEGREEDRSGRDVVIAYLETARSRRDHRSGARASTSCRGGRWPTAGRR